MGQSLAIPRVIPEDWKRLDLIVNKIKMRLGSTSSPIHVGLTLTGLTASRLIGTNASKALESVTIGTGLDYTRPTLSLSHLGIEDLTDPGADRIFFWDNSASASKWLAVGNSIAITTTTIDTIQDIRTTASPTFVGLTLSAGPLVLSGKMTAGAWGSPIDVTGTRKYGFELHYSGNDYDVFGIRSRANLITTADSSTRTATGAELQASNSNGISVSVLCGAKCSSTGKSTSSSATISTMRAVDLITEWGAKDTVTNLYNTHIKCITRNAAGEGSFGTGYGIYLENIAVGGTGQALDAGIRFQETGLGGVEGYNYGIDFSGATYTTAEMLIGNAKIASSSNSLTIQPATDSTAFFQVLDADGGTPILNIDTTNERVGIKIAGPSVSFHIKDGGDDYVGGGHGGTEFLIEETDATKRVAFFLVNNNGDRSGFFAYGTNVPTAAFRGNTQLSLDSGCFIIKADGTTITNLSTGFNAISQLHIYEFNSVVGVTTGLTIEKGGTGDAIIQYLLTGVRRWVTGIDNSDSDKYKVASSADLNSNAWLVLDINGNLGLGGETAPETLLELTHATPYVTLHNSTHEDTDGGGESRLIFKREDGAGTETACAQIEASHDGVIANNQLGKLQLSVNTGAGLVQALEIGSDLKATFAANVSIANCLFQNEQMQMHSDTKTLVDGSATGFFEIAIATGELLGGNITYAIYVTNGTDYQSHSGAVTFVAVNKAGTVTSDIEEQYSPANEAEIKTAGTLTDDFTITDGTGKITLNCNANTNLAGPTIVLKYTVITHSLNTITAL